MASKESYLAKNLIYLRKRANKSQNQVAKALELNRGNIASYENGNAEPSASNLLKIVKYFNVKLSYLIEKDLEKEENNVKKLDSEGSNGITTAADTDQMVHQAGEILKVVKSQVVYSEYLLERSEDVPQELILTTQMIFDMAKMTKQLASDTIKMGEKLIEFQVED